MVMLGMIKKTRSQYEYEYGEREREGEMDWKCAGEVLQPLFMLRVATRCFETKTMVTSLLSWDSTPHKQDAASSRSSSVICGCHKQLNMRAQTPHRFLGMKSPTVPAELPGCPAPSGSCGKIDRHAWGVTLFWFRPVQLPEQKGSTSGSAQSDLCRHLSNDMSRIVGKNSV